MTQKKIFEFGGYIAAILLVAFGIGSIAMSYNGRNEVRTDIKREYIVGSEDMSPAAIKKEVQQANLPAEITGQLPTCDVAGKAINSGERAKCFASYMRIHTLEATGGYTYSQMGRYQAQTTAPKSELSEGGGTDNASYAVTDTKTQQPVANGARDLWITETALSTALNVSYMADQLALFSLVVGIALLLTGVGFIILAAAGALRRTTAAAAPRTEVAPAS